MARANGKGLRFTRLYLENWKNFTHVDVQLSPRVFLVGPNASGKSNLLDVFRFLQEIVSVGGGFREAVLAPHRGGVSKLRCLAARRNPNIVIRISIGNNGIPDAWTYELGFGQDNRQRPIIKKEIVTRRDDVILARPDEKDRKDPERLSQTYLEQVYANRDFREISAFFQSLGYLHIVPQLVREPDRWAIRKQDPFGASFLEQIAKTAGRTQKARLRRILESLRVAVPQLKELEIDRDDRGTPHLRGKYEHWRPKGAWQSEEQFSDGTLRLLGLLWTLLDGAGPILLEEPELSLHPEVVRYVPQMFARTQRRTGRQLLVSTHSSDLLVDDGIGFDEVLLLRPTSEGTAVRPVSDFRDIRDLLNNGVSMPEAIIPRTRPENADQLALFGD